MSCDAAGRTWLVRAEITQPLIGLQSRSKSRLQLSGGLSFASVLLGCQIRTTCRVAAGTPLIFLTDKMPALSKRLTLTNAIGPYSGVSNIERVRGLNEVLDELGGVFGEEVLGQVADCAVAETAPGSCLACECKDCERGDRNHIDHFAMRRAEF